MAGTTSPRFDRIVFYPHTDCMKIVAIALSLAVFTSGSLVFPVTALSGPNCTCRHVGGDVLEGQSACIKSPKGMTMARCERVLNNTSWKMLDTPCPYSEVPDKYKNQQELALLEVDTENQVEIAVPGN
ncbi:MAG: hypothetical protein WBD01_09855 [Salaquimonas sp.]